MAKKTRSPTIIWSFAGVAIPFCAFASTVKLDSRYKVLGHRRTLDEQLDYHPITRRAWYKAVEVNKSYQDKLKEEILDLEEKLAKKELVLA